MVDDRPHQSHQSHVDLKFPTAGTGLPKVAESSPHVHGSGSDARLSPADRGGASAASAGKTDHDVRDIVDTDWDIPFIEFTYGGVSDFDNGTQRLGDSYKPQVAQRRDQAIAQGSGLSRQVSPGEAHARKEDDAHYDHLLDPWDVEDEQHGDGSQGGAKHQPESQRVEGIKDAGHIDGFERLIAQSSVKTDADFASRPSPERHATHGRFHRSRMFIPVCAVVACISFLGSALLWQHRYQAVQERTALSLCSAAMARYRTADDELKQALQDTAAQQNITTEQVSDQHVVIALKETVAKARALELSNSQGQCGIESETKLNNGHAALAKETAPKMVGLVSELKTRAEAVAASNARYVKALSQARTQLTAALASARTVLGESQYQVTDNDTRIHLEETINVANTLLPNQDAALSAVRKSVTDLHTAQNSVTAAMNEYATQQGTQTQSQTNTNGNTPTQSQSQTASGTSSASGSQTASGTPLTSGATQEQSGAGTGQSSNN